MKKTKKKNKNPKTQTANHHKDKKETRQKDYIFWILLSIIIISGLYFRTTDYAQEGLKNDSPTFLAGGLLWFYPHNFYPGMMHYQPPVGHFLAACGCMLSGEDFSGISQANPYFLPNLPYLIGKQYTAAENYCFLPIYIASILVFLGFAIFSMMLLGRKESLFAIAFIAYNPTILSMGRNIFTSVFIWLFSLYGLILLWKYYDSKKGSRKETIYSALTGAIFGIAFATQLTAAVFVLLTVFILLEKYKNNMNFTKGNAKIPVPMIKTLAIFITIFAIVTMIPYQMNPKNLTDIYTTYKAASPNDANPKIGLGTINTFKTFIPTMTIIDTLLLIYSIYILYMLFRKQDKSPKEKFIYYTVLLFITVTTLFTNTLGGIRAIPFFFTIPLLIALTFSDKKYSILQKLKIKDNKRTHIVYIIIIIYIFLNIATLYPAKPYYFMRTNNLYCSISDSPHCSPIPHPSDRQTTSELRKLLKDNETFYKPERYTGETYFYLRNKDYYNLWLLETYIQKEYQVKPNLYDIIRTFDFDNRKIQYIVLRPNTNNKEEKQIIDSLTPFKTVTIKNIPVAYIYSVDQLPNLGKNN